MSQREREAAEYARFTRPTRLADEERVLRAQLRAMSIEAAQLAEENLPPDTERGPDAHDSGDGLELGGDQRVRKHGIDLRGGERVVESGGEADAAVEGSVGRLHQFE